MPRRSMSSSLPLIIIYVSVCMELHNFGKENYIARVQPIARDFRDHDRLLVVPQDNVVEPQPRHLKSKVKSTLRDHLCECVKEGRG